jgi:hypothetical protein
MEHSTTRQEDQYKNRQQKQQEPTNNQQNYKIKTITTLKKSNNQLTINKNNERSAPSEHDISTIP